jgi:hypothetical protein
MTMVDLSQYSNLKKISIILSGSPSNSSHYSTKQLVVGNKPKLTHFTISGVNVNLDCLDISGCPKLEDFSYTETKKPVSLNFSNCNFLRILSIIRRSMVSADFLNTLPNPEKLEELRIYSNNIQPTDITIFSRFVNLKHLLIGTTRNDLEKGKHNEFYGSFKS